MDKNKEQTEWELKENVIYCCKKCADKLREEWQKENKNLQINIGDFVKIGITDKNGTEHLWFKITAIKKAEFIGRCENVPVVIEKLKHNDTTKFKFKDIEDYRKK